MRRALIAALSCAIATVAAGCYLITPYSDLTSGWGKDAAPDVVSGGDAAPDGVADGGDAAPVGFCAGLHPAPTFCRDFDDGGALADAFDTVSAPAGGTLAVDTSASRSPPASLVASDPATSDPGAGPLDYVVQSFTVTREIEIAFDARADVLGEANTQATLVYLGAVPPDDSSASLSLIYYVTSTSSALEEERSQPYASFPSDLGGAPPIGVWRHYDIDVKLASGSATATVVVDGAPLVQNRPLQAPTWVAGKMKVGWGLWWINASKAAWGFHYDNLVVNAQ